MGFPSLELNLKMQVEYTVREDIASHPPILGNEFPGGLKEVQGWSHHHIVPV